MSSEKLLCEATGRECESSPLCRAGIDMQDERQRERGIYPLQVGEAVKARWDNAITKAAESHFCALKREEALRELSILSLHQTIRIAATALAKNIALARMLHRNRG
jgi:hypothetical protein